MDINRHLMTWLNSNSVPLSAFLCAGATSKFMWQNHAAKPWGGAREPCSLNNVCDRPPFATPSRLSGGEGAKLPQSAQRSRSGFECRYSVSERLIAVRRLPARGVEADLKDAIVAPRPASRPRARPQPPLSGEPRLAFLISSSVRPPPPCWAGCRAM